MKKGVFGTWFKELASLIFTQTVQAFLLAIIMSIIVNALSSSTSNGATYGAGLLAIIALSQFGKIELLIKNIFGVTSQFGGSMQDGRGGLLASVMALRAGKRVLDNAPKVVSGASNRIKASKTIKSLEKQKEALNAGDISAGAMNEMQQQADEFIDNAQTGAAMAAGARAFNGGNSSGNGVGISSSQIDQLIAAVKEQTSTIKSQKMDDDKNDKNSKMEDLDKKIREAQLKKRDSTRQIVSGVTETAGAIAGGTIGAAAGAVYSLGTGDDFGQSVGQGIGFGVGAGDKVGGAIPRARSGIDHFKYDLNEIKIERDKAQQKIDNEEKNKKVYNQVTETLKNANKSGFMKNRTSQDRAKAVKRLQENAKKKIDASNM